jgi:3-oxoacyl-[acyl-carrier protein] reductase
MDLQLKDQVALVAAASKGLGKAAAAALAAEGAKVAICSRSELIEKAAEEIRAATGAEVLAVRTDLTDQAQVQAMVQRTLDRFGRIDILVINAGGPPPGDFLDLTVADWETGVKITILSTLYLCYAVIPHMLGRGSGCILCNQSFVVKQPVPRLITANSLRMAVIGLMKTLANELGPKGIRVNTVNPGWTWTDRVQQLMADRAKANQTTIEQESAGVVQGLPLKRMGTVEEYGKTIAWLASPAAGFIHGHNLMIDGGGTHFPL